MELIKVNQNKIKHIRLLFLILAKRKFNISHQDSICYKEHKNFVLNHPYRFWYLIKDNNNYIGSIYVTFNNEIGVSFIISSRQIYMDSIRTILKIHKPLEPIRSIRSKFFIINTNPENNLLKDSLLSLGSSHLQNTYVFKD